MIVKRMIKRIRKKHNKLAYRVIIPLTLLIIISITVFIINISKTLIENELIVYEKMIESFDEFINMQVSHYINQIEYTFSDYETIKNLEIEYLEKESMMDSLLEKNRNIVKNIIIVEDKTNIENYKIYTYDQDLNVEIDFFIDKLAKVYERQGNKNRFPFYDKATNKLYILGEIENSLVILQADLDELYKSFDAGIYSSSSSIGLLTSDGSIMAHSDSQIIGKNVYDLGFSTDILNEVFKSVSRNNNFKGNFKIKHPDDIKSNYNEFRYNFVPIKVDEYNLNWVIMFEIPTNVFEDKMMSVGITIGLGGFITILVLVIFSRFIINKSLDPIDEIVTTMNRAAEGDLTIRSNVRSANEIEVISLRLNEMLHNMEVDRNDLVNQKNEISELLNEVEDLVQENDRIYYETIKTLAKTIDAKDSYTGGHCDRVTEFSTKIGLKLGLPSEDIRVLSYSGMLHDIGKIGIAESIITKEGKLSDEEFMEIKKHPQIGFDILKDINFLKRSSQVVIRHHEKIDGSGYPNNLKGDEIDILSRIVTVSDSFDAMSSDRSYRKALSKDECIKELIRCSGSQFDEKVVNTLIELIKSGDINPFDN